jgi:hypothetical protein
MYEWMNGWMNGWMDGWMDRRKILIDSTTGFILASVEHIPSSNFATIKASIDRLFSRHYINSLTNQSRYHDSAQKISLNLTLISHIPLFLLGQPSGLNAARKLRNTRREQRWADKQYKKRALGTAFRSNPFGGASHAKGIVLEKM